MPAGLFVRRYVCVCIKAGRFIFRQFPYDFRILWVIPWKFAQGTIPLSLKSSPLLFVGRFFPKLTFVWNITYTFTSITQKLSHGFNRWKGELILINVQKKSPTLVQRFKSYGHFCPNFGPFFHFFHDFVQEYYFHGHFLAQSII